MRRPSRIGLNVGIWSIATLSVLQRNVRMRAQSKREAEVLVGRPVNGVDLEFINHLSS